MATDDVETTEATATTKPWWKKKWGIAAIAFGVLVLFGAMTDDGDQSTTPAASEENDEASEPADEPEAAEETTEDVQLVAVPDVVGMDAEEARSQLEAAGFTVELRNGSPAPDRSLENTVTGQNPDGGDEAEAGDQVTLTIHTEVLMGSWEPFEVSGSGDDIVDLVVPENEPAVAEITYDGGSNFSVLTFDAAGNRIDLLVNEIGSYSGTVPLNFMANEEVAEAEITASGPWTIAVRPLKDARQGTASTTGRGADVVLVEGLGDRARMTHNGSSNFAVHAYGSGRDLLVNEIGPYEGTVRVPAGTVVLVVEADGDWTVDFE